MLIPQKTSKEFFTLSYNHFTSEERKCLQDLLAQHYSFRKIADYLGRSPSSVSREVRRNKSKHSKKANNPFNYHYWRANSLAVARRRDDRCVAIKPHSKEWYYVIFCITQRYWSPETIVLRWRLENPESKHFGISTIYRYVDKERFPGITRKNLRRKGKKIQPKSSNYNTIKPDRIIPDWPPVIKQRLRIGDWEGDTVQGKPGHGVIITQVDRKSRYLVAKLCNTKQAEDVKLAVIEMMKGLPVESMSLDNGSEFAKFREIERALGAEIYFAEPHKPWQRGTNENTNGLLRAFYPKGCDLLSVTQEELDYVVSLINDRPRKCLGGRSPAEIFFSKTVALA